jgi:nicotinamidase-related amidase
MADLPHVMDVVEKLATEYNIKAAIHEHPSRPFIFLIGAMMSLKLDPRTTALVVIDLQKGIVQRPLVPRSASQVVEKAAELGRHFGKVGGTIVLVHVSFSDNAADRLNQPVDAPMQGPPGGMPAEFSEFAPEIGSLHADVIITKRQLGAFHGTEMDLQLRRRGIATIVLGGIATNFGVETTAIEAWQHNYAVVIAEDLCATMSDDMHKFSIEKMLPRVARIRSTAEIISALQRL